MSIAKKTLFAVLCVSLLAVAACAGIRTDRDMAHDRANAYLAANPETDPPVAVAIRRLELVAGMTPTEVRAAWGEPVAVERSLRGIREGWYFGCYYPHICHAELGTRNSPFVDRERYGARAWFSEGRLVEWGL